MLTFPPRGRCAEIARLYQQRLKKATQFLRDGFAIFCKFLEIGNWGGALGKLGVEWIVRLIQSMYANARSCIRIGEGCSEEFQVNVGVHQGSVLSPLFFSIVLEALSREFRSGVPWEDLYADDLVIITESLEECVIRLLA